MKRFTVNVRIVLITMLVGFVFSACEKFDDEELWNKINELDSRVGDLEEQVNDLNNEISSLQVFTTDYYSIFYR